MSILYCAVFLFPNSTALFIGHDFDWSKVSEIRVNVTTEAEVREWLGHPFTDKARKRVKEIPEKLQTISWHYTKTFTKRQKNLAVIIAKGGTVLAFTANTNFKGEEPRKITENNGYTINWH